MPGWDSGQDNSSSSGGFDWGRLFASLLAGYSSYQNAREGQRAADAAKNPKPSFTYRAPYMNELISQMVPYLLSEMGNVYRHRGAYTGYTPESSGLDRIQALLAPYVSGERYTNGLGGAGMGMGGGMMGGGGFSSGVNGEPFRPGEGARDAANGGYVDQPSGGSAMLGDLASRETGPDIVGRAGGGTSFGGEFLDTNDPYNLNAREMARLILSGGRLATGVLPEIGRQIYTIGRNVMRRNQGEDGKPRQGSRMEDFLTARFQNYLDSARAREGQREQERHDAGIRINPPAQDGGQSRMPQSEQELIDQLNAGGPRQTQDVGVSARIYAYIHSLPPEQQLEAFNRLRQNAQTAGWNRWNEGQMFSGASNNAFFGLGGPMSMMIRDGGGGGGGNMRANMGDDYRFGGTGGGFSAY